MTSKRRRYLRKQKTRLAQYPRPVSSKLSRLPATHNIEELERELKRRGVL